MTQKSVLQTDDNFAHKIEYPHNLLRNLAKEGALTEYVLGKIQFVCICIFNSQAVGWDSGVPFSVSNFLKAILKPICFQRSQTSNSGLLL